MFSSVTSGAVLHGFNLPIVDKFGTVLHLRLCGGSGIITPLPVQVGYFIERTKLRGGIPMAIQAERHAERHGMIYLFHLVDLTVALDAAHSAVYMHGMIKIDVVRKLMDLHPRDWLARLRTLTNQREP